MNKLTATLSIALGVGLLACAVLAYLWIDRSISLSYMKQSYETERSSVESLQTMLALEWKGIPEGHLQKKLEDMAERMANRNIIVKREGEIIWFDQVAFYIKDGRLDGVGSPSR